MVVISIACGPDSTKNYLLVSLMSAPLASPVPLPGAMDPFDPAVLMEVLPRTIAAMPASLDRALLERVLPLIASGDPSDLLSFLRTECSTLGSSTGVLVTGYYEAVLRGARERSSVAHFPVYGVPADPSLRCLSRADIDAGALLGQGLEIAWVEDPIELFFLHVQGSGRIELPDGNTIRLGFAGSNDHPYRALAAVLDERTLLPRARATRGTITATLRGRPDLLEILAGNPRYIFFAERSTGATGTLGVPLAPGLSIAADPEIYPLGTLGLLEARLPIVTAGGVTGWRDVCRLTVVHDTGAAIRGADRIDLFMGLGAEAAAAAGEMKAPGQFCSLRAHRS